MLTLEKVAPMMSDREEDLSFVKNIVQSNDFRSLMHIHNEVKHGSTKTNEPVTKNAVAMSHLVRKCAILIVDGITDLLNGQLKSKFVITRFFFGERSIEPAMRTR